MEFYILEKALFNFFNVRIWHKSFSEITLISTNCIQVKYTYMSSCKFYKLSAYVFY
jgi:hypothetical protein